ncbi:hypothetical protein OTU49_001075, partial [Cherax quadricarinatus]
ALGFPLLTEEEPAWFPEKELRSAQDITPQRFTALERALLCLSVSTESLRDDEESQGRGGNEGNIPNNSSQQALLPQDSKTSTAASFTKAANGPSTDTNNTWNATKATSNNLKAKPKKPAGGEKGKLLHASTEDKPQTRRKSEERDKKKKDKNNRSSM